MRVRYTRTGGFAAAMRREYTVDSAAISPEGADELSRLIEAADFFQLPSASPSPRAMRDTFRYRISVEMGGREHTVEMDQAAVPDRARALLDWLDQRARLGGG